MDVEFLLFVKFRQNLFSSFGGKVKNVKVYAGRRTTRYDNSSLEYSAQVASKVKWRLKPEKTRFRKCCASVNLFSDGRCR